MLRHIKWIWVVALFLAVSMAAIWLILYQEPVILADRVIEAETALEIPVMSHDGASPLRFAIGTMLTPKSTFRHYARLAHVLSQSLHRPVRVIQRAGYENTNQLLRDGEADLAFLCSGAYADLSARTRLYLLAAPSFHGKPVYWSEVIVPKSAATQKLDDLKNISRLRIAYTDPLSNTGYLVVRAMLGDAHISAEPPAADVIWTGSHEESVHLVASGLADVAGVDVLVLEAMVSADPELKQQVRTIIRSPDFASPPLVATANLPNDARNQVTTALLRLHETPDGRELLSGMGIEGFVAVDDAAYEPVRKLLETVKEAPNE